MLLALAANTSFGGLPVLARLLAADNNLPHLFALQADRQVHRYGIYFLAVASAVLLIVAGGDMNMLVPLFAIGVFVGFTLSQAGMVRHWVTSRPAGWRWRAALNGFGATLTLVAVIVVTVSKFAEGGWLIAVALPLIVAAMQWVNRSYTRIGQRLEVGKTPVPPRPRRSLVVVPVRAVDRLAREALTAALSLGDRVVAVNIAPTDDDQEAQRFADDWGRWDPGVELVRLTDARRRLDEPLIDYLGHVPEPHVFVLIAEVEPEHAWQRMLQNQRGAVLARSLRRRTDVVVCRMRFRVGSRTTATVS
jgi:hypothetical protein